MSWTAEAAAKWIALNLTPFQCCALQFGEPGYAAHLSRGALVLSEDPTTIRLSTAHGTFLLSVSRDATPPRTGERPGSRKKKPC